MVCIIDDREDVWTYAQNLVHVQPYIFFKNTGDINDPHGVLASKANKKDDPELGPERRLERRQSIDMPSIDDNEQEDKEVEDKDDKIQDDVSMVSDDLSLSGNFFSISFSDFFAIFSFNFFQMMTQMMQNQIPKSLKKLMIQYKKNKLQPLLFKSPRRMT